MCPTHEEYKETQAVEELGEKTFYLLIKFLFFKL